VDDLLATLGLLVMIEQQAVLWQFTVYQPPTLPVFYAAALSCTTIIWYVRPSCSCPSSIAIDVFFPLFRLARGSILASVIRIMRGGPLRVAALYVSGLFVVLYIMIIAQFVWICQMDEKADSAGYVSFFGFHFRVVSASRCHERPHPVSHGAISRRK
jgi:hypothetical protein